MSNNPKCPFHLFYFCSNLSMSSWCLFQILRDYHLQCKHKLVKGVKTNLTNFNKITPLISLLLCSSFWWGCFLKNTNYTFYKRTSIHIVLYFNTGCLNLPQIQHHPDPLMAKVWKHWKRDREETCAFEMSFQGEYASTECSHQVGSGAKFNS